MSNANSLQSSNLNPVLSFFLISIQKLYRVSRFPSLGQWICNIFPLSGTASEKRKLQPYGVLARQSPHGMFTFCKMWVSSLFRRRQESAAVSSVLGQCSSHWHYPTAKDTKLPLRRNIDSLFFGWQAAGKLPWKEDIVHCNSQEWIFLSLWSCMEGMGRF